MAAYNEVIQGRLKSLLTPAVFGQLACYRSLGLRGRLLGLPVMAAAGRQWLSTANNLIGSALILLAALRLIPAHLAID